jgi:predicted RND superfamily exporter protein
VTYARWVAGIERHRWTILLASLLLCILSALSLTRLRLDFDVLGMLPEGSPAFDDFKAFVEDFGQLNELVILVDEAPLETLQAFADGLGERLARLETVERVQARVDMERVLDGVLGRYVYNYLPGEGFDELERRITPAGLQAQVAALRAILSAPFDLTAAQAVLEDPFGLQRLVATELTRSYGSKSSLRDGYLTAADGGALLVLVRPRAPAFDTAFSARLLQQVGTEAAALQAEPALGPVRVRYTGSYVYALEDAGTLRADVARYTLLALAGVLAVFYAGYRNLRILPFVAYPLVLTTLLTFAISLLLFDQLNATAMAFAAILYGLSIDSGIHFYTRLAQERQRRDLRAAVTATLAALGRANLAASGTSAAVFCVIGFSVLGGVRQLGLLTTIGMLLTMAEFFTLYPALGFLVPSAAGERRRRLETPRLAAIARAGQRHARGVTVAAAAAAIGLFVVATRVGVDATLTHLRPGDSEAVRVEDEIVARFGRASAGGAFLVRAANLEEALAGAELVADRLRSYQRDGEVNSFHGVSALLPSARQQRRRLERYNRLPRAQIAADLKAALARGGFVPERFDPFFTDFVRPREEILTIDHPALAPLGFLLDRHVRRSDVESVVATFVESAPSVSLATLVQRLRDDLPQVPITVAARSLLEDELERVLRRELVAFLALTFASNLILLVLGFGGLWTSVAILGPQIVVLVTLFAAMWLAGVSVDPVNLVVSTLVIGLGVDYGVYVTAAARERGGAAEAILYGGRALAVTALTTVAGFGFLALSRYPALASLGILSAAGLTLSLAAALTLLPAFLHAAEKRSPACLGPDG